MTSELFGSNLYIDISLICYGLLLTFLQPTLSSGGVFFFKCLIYNPVMETVQPVCSSCLL